MSKVNFRQKVKLMIVLVLSLINLSSEKLNKKNVVLAINCGGMEYTDKINDITYIADQYYDQGTTSDHGLNYEISNTKDQLIYQTERWSSNTITYSLPLIEPGKYVLILKFSEVYFNLNNQKVFDVSIGSTKVIKNLDIFKKVGRNAALDEYVEFELKNKNIYYKNQIIRDGYDTSENKLIVKFIKGTKDNPKINGILLVKGGIQNTDYVEKQKLIEEKNKEKTKENNKKFALDLRHNSDEDFSEDALLNSSDLETLRIKEYQGILSIFNTKPGYAIIISIILFFILNFLINFIN